MKRQRQNVVLLLIGTMLWLQAAPQHVNADDRTLVRIAGGAVEVQLPEDWGVWQVPYRREMRAVFAQSPPRRPRRMPEDGVWLSYRAQSGGAPHSFEYLSEQLVARAGEELGEFLQTSPTQQFQLAGWPAVRTNFSITEPRIGSSAGRSLSEGFYMLVGTPWGVLQLQAIAPADDYEQRVNTFEQIASSIKFQKPQATHEAVADTVHHATTILGTWKAFRSRMTLQANGRIIIKPDVFYVASISGADQTNQRVDWLTGRFTARGDLLFVTWDDGSHLNFRWRLNGDELLLTDHEGQISQLRRILE